MQFSPQEICQALRNWRIRARLQQAAVAECLGVTQSQVSRWESGRDLPRPHNIEAIRRLIWGPEAEPLRALRHFVEHSGQHLLLIDAQGAIIARSRPLTCNPNPVDRFSWVLDPVRNPAAAPAWRRFHLLMQQPDGAVGLTLTLPFRDDGEFWCITIGLTIYSVGGARICLAEPRFSRQDGDGDVSVEEIRLDAERGERRALTLWPKKNIAPLPA